MATSISKPRWYRLTPDRFPFFLLAVEAILLASERLDSFSFNQHKGWTVLIAVATLAVAMLLTLFWFLLSLFFRWRFQFSVRALAVFVLVCAVVCSWLAVEMQQARRQREAVAAIEKAGASVGYDLLFDGHSWVGEPGPVPAWLVTLAGEDFFIDVGSVQFSYGDVTDDDLKQLEQFPRLRRLWLDGTDVTDAGLEHLGGLSHLRQLGLSETAVTDAGMKHLIGLSDLQQLDLTRTKVTPEGARSLTQVYVITWCHTSPSTFR